ncbi:MAG: Rrf2 family transcriptional regulator [Bryobacterales bacterium]|nr:Rrf2 family transcriptional regulator [Bryobacterales bacterium]
MKLMFYSRSAEYAIRAFARLSQAPPGTYVMARVLAEREEIPAHFLAKILQDLARRNFIQSNKGPNGGFALIRDGQTPKVTVLDVVQAVDGLDCCERCAVGLPECNDRTPCGMHDSWKAVRSRIIEYLGGTTIADVAAALDRKRDLLAKSAKPRRAGRPAANRKG